jgi:DNA-binding XRE family transcriptional regulator
MEYKDILKQIVNDRSDLKIYQYEMAEELDIDERTYRSIEKGVSKMSLEQYLKVCKKLQKAPSHYLGGSSPVNNGTINGVMTNNGEINLNANNIPPDSAKTFQLLIEALVEKMGKG